ncbi:MAG: ComF family protein [Pseudomonadota bacterium]
MQTHVKRLHGNWDLGFALDKHMLKSVYIGNDEYGHARFNNTRTPAGEALYQLKYEASWDKAKLLAQAVHDDICSHLPNIDMVIPMPPSQYRPRQPVTEVAAHLATLLDVPMFDNFLLRQRTGAKLKNMHSREDKDAALKGKITLGHTFRGDGPWNALLLDDLHDTGASLSAACEALRACEKIAKVYVAALTWKRLK